MGHEQNHYIQNVTTIFVYKCVFNQSLQKSYEIVISDLNRPDFVRTVITLNVLKHNQKYVIDIIDS